MDHKLRASHMLRCLMNRNATFGRREENQGDEDLLAEFGDLEDRNDLVHNPLRGSSVLGEPSGVSRRHLPRLEELNALHHLVGEQRGWREVRETLQLCHNPLLGFEFAPTFFAALNVRHKWRSSETGNNQRSGRRVADVDFKLAR